MLSLAASLVPDPHASLVFLPLPREVLLVCFYCFSPSESLICPALRLRRHRRRPPHHDLSLLRVLAFWEAFPGCKHTQHSLSCISVDPGLRLVRL